MKTINKKEVLVAEMKGACQGQGWWRGKFRGCGYRFTVGREAILQALFESEKHLSADDIYMKVHAKYPTLGLTTIYRTLDVLTELGMVHKLDFGDGRARYELSEGPRGAHHHHHLVCSNCNKVINYTDFIDEELELLKQTEKGLSEKYDFTITNHLIQFYGICGACRSHKENR